MRRGKFGLVHLAAHRVQCFGEEARHVHLRHIHLFGDLGLRHLSEEPHRECSSLPFGKAAINGRTVSTSSTFRYEDRCRPTCLRLMGRRLARSACRWTEWCSCFRRWWRHPPIHGRRGAARPRRRSARVQPLRQSARAVAIFAWRSLHWRGTSTAHPSRGSVGGLRPSPSARRTTGSPSRCRSKRLTAWTKPRRATWIRSSTGCPRPR